EARVGHQSEDRQGARPRRAADAAHPRRRGDRVRRREFITLLSGAAAVWLRKARAQQAVPVVGFLGVPSRDTFGYLGDAFHPGLNETGYVTVRNLAMPYPL